MTKKLLTFTIYFLIFSLAAYLRLVGGNWDQDQHLHPDERFLTMVANSLKFPATWTDYFNTDLSTLNPHNVNFGFYVYGTFPVHFVTLISHFLQQSDYVQLTLVGRTVSAFVDLFTLLFVILISRRISQHWLTPILAGYFYAIAVLPIQLSHYFAVDPFLTFFITICLYFLILLIKIPRISHSILYSVLVGLFFGLAMSSKITAVLLLPTIGLVFLIHLIKSKRLAFSFLLGLLFLLSMLLTVRLAYPYLFSATDFIPTGLNPKLLTNWHELKSYGKPNFFYPPGVSWTHAPSFIFPLVNMFLYGWGVPLFIIVSLGFAYSVSLLRKQVSLIPLVVFLIVYFLYEGQQYAMPMRYFYPIYPILAITGSLLVLRLVGHLTLKRVFLLVTLLLIVSIWPASFITIYKQPNSRITASEWIYTHIPPGSTISCEYWDDCLPLNLPNYPSSSIYTGIRYSLYDSESPEKWQQINSDILKTDYLILSSNRLYASIMTAPEHYPDSYEFYRNLFSGKLGFTLVAQFVSRPNIPLPFVQKCFTPPGIYYGQIATLIQTCPVSGLSLVDDYADETFTVYDHPKVIIFKKNQNQR